MGPWTLSTLVIWLLRNWPCAGRAAPALPTIFGRRRRRLLLIGEPPTPIICRRAADANCCCVVMSLKFSMTKKRPSENFEDRTKLFRESLKKFSWPPTPRRVVAAADFFWTAAADQIGRCAAGQYYWDFIRPMSWDHLNCCTNLAKEIAIVYMRKAGLDEYIALTQISV